MKHLTASLEKSCTSTRPAFDLSIRLYRSVVGREIGLAGIGAGDRVLNVGCGAMPYTAAILARDSGAYVYALDRDEGVPPRARQNLARANADGRVDVVLGDGATVDEDTAIPLSELDVALVAAQAEPKSAILSHLRSLVEGPDRIVVRQPRLGAVTNYDGLPDEFVPAAAVEHSMPTLERSLLFEMK